MFFESLTWGWMEVSSLTLGVGAEKETRFWWKSENIPSSNSKDFYLLYILCVFTWPSSHSKRRKYIHKSSGGVQKWGVCDWHKANMANELVLVSSKLHFHLISKWKTWKRDQIIKEIKVSLIWSLWKRWNYWFLGSYFLVVVSVI